MNVILFKNKDHRLKIPRQGERGRHLVEILRKRVGDIFDVGVLGGPLGQGRVEQIGEEFVEISLCWGRIPPPGPSIFLLQALPRPPTARLLLRETASLGFRGVHFFQGHRSEPSYAQSRLWKNDAWLEPLREGASQAYSTIIPEFRMSGNLLEAIAALPKEAICLALDNYEASESLADYLQRKGAAEFLPEDNTREVAVYLTLGPERGWSAEERVILKQAGFCLLHLGWRAFRIETALVLAFGMMAQNAGWLRQPFLPEMRFGGIAEDEKNCQSAEEG
jgi:16S rRNA (uracil1498-N3)-methyltransferase